MTNIQDNGWHSIATAPKDGTEITIWNADWDCAFIVRWGEYPDNPVVDDNEKDCDLYGWLFKDPSMNGPREERGFLGWDEDPMPTHWILPPTRRTA